jgi:dolichol kinase
MSPWLALLLSFGYVFLMLGLGEGMRRWRDFSPDFTRKFIHISVGMYSILAVLVFDRWEWAIIPPAAFVIINFLDWKYGLVQAMTSSDRSNLGTIYFPLSFIAVIWVFWDRPELLVASLMPLTWGDSLASVVGRRIGRRLYTVAGSTRSLEGSLTMFVLSALTTWAVLVVFGADNPIGVALLTAAVATLAEAISPWGLDNLAVPAVSALLLAWLYA